MAVNVFAIPCWLQTVRTNVTYTKGEEDAFVAINPRAAPEPPMHSHPAASSYAAMGSNQHAAPPPSYNYAVSGAAAAAAVPPPPVNMDNHPAMRRNTDSRLSKDQEASMDGNVPDYLLPAEPSDQMAQRPPAPIPGGPGPMTEATNPMDRPLPDPGNPQGNIQQQDYINVDTRPPAPIPGDGVNYENFQPWICP